MGLNVNGATFALENNAVSITSNSVKGLSFDSSYNIPIESSRPYFVAQGDTAAWQQWATGWQTPVLDYAVVNNGSHYNTSNGRFTAPVSGVYYFEYSLYVQKYTDTAPAGYTHPILIVNGSSTIQKASYTTDYRLRTRTYNTGSYSTDTQVNDILRLTAADYVQIYIYSSTANRYYPPYALFSGCLLS